MKRQPTTITAVLSNHSVLDNLHRHSLHLQQITAIVRRCLPPAASCHLQACSFDGTQLTLYAHSAAQATPLRLASSALLQSLRQDPKLAQLIRIRVRIAVSDDPQKHRSPPAPALTDTTAELLSDLAETVINPTIRAILRRLSRRHKTQKNEAI